MSTGSLAPACAFAASWRRGRRNQSSMTASSPTGMASHDRSTMKFISMMRCSLATHFQHREEGFLRNLYVSELLHALLAFFLFLEELALAADVAAIALRQHVLAQRLDGRARNDGATDGGLHGDFEHLPRDELLHLVDELAAAMVGGLAVRDDRQRIHLVAVDEDIELHEWRRLEARELVVERGVAAARGLQAIEEVEHDFGER